MTIGTAGLHGHMEMIEQRCKDVNLLPFIWPCQLGRTVELREAPQ